MISVIIAAYNCDPFLEQAIRSIQKQALSDLEVIIVNDGSTDNTRQLAEQLATEDKRIIVINQSNSGGPAQPRNIGIARSKGEFICFLDPDDYWYPEKLAKQIAIFDLYTDVDMVFSDMHRVDKNGHNLGPTYLQNVRYMDTAADHLDKVSPSLYISRASFYAYSSAGVVGPVTSSIVLRRRAIAKFEELFPLDLAVGEDIDLWFRILMHGKAAFINEPLHAYRQHAASLMHNPSRVTAGMIASHTKNFHRAKNILSPRQNIYCRKRIAAHLFDLGYGLRLKHDYSNARSAFWRSFIWYPNYRTAIALLKILLQKMGNNYRKAH